MVPFKVKPMAVSIMPPGTSGAAVRCYVSAPNPREAVETCLAALREDGIALEELVLPIGVMQANKWAQHVSEQWPDYASQLPTQEEFENSIKAGKVVYGPFGTF